MIAWPNHGALPPLPQIVGKAVAAETGPGSNPGSPIFRCLGKLLRGEEVREDAGFRRFCSSRGSRSGTERADGDFSFGCKVLAARREGMSVIPGD